MSKIVRLIAIFFFGFSLVISTPHCLFPTKLVAQYPQIIQMLQQGINLYEAEQYDEAIRIWNTALSKKPEKLSQALILNNLALAYQSLGRWQEAETIIASSLKILKNLDTSTPTYTEILAKASNTQGYLQWLQGNFDEAIFNWEVAAENYLKVGDRENAIRCRLNQTKALQAAGLSSKAKTILEQIEQELTQTPNFQLKAIGLRHLGNVLRDVGELKRSETLLQSSLSLSESPDTLLELGNTERALSDSYLATEQAELADKYAETAIDLYQKAFKDGNNLKAGLNKLSLLISVGKWSDINVLIPQIDRSLESLPYSRAGIYARLNFIRSLSCIKESAENNNLACVNKVRQDRLRQILALSKPDIKIPDWQNIARDIEVIIPQATDSQTRSYALGELGHLYESEQKWQLAQNYTQRALLTLEGLKSPEIRYRWQWQSGRIWQQQGRIPEAISAYSAAIDNLKSVRRDLLIVNSEAQFSFRDNIEPIYRELVDLLLQQEEGVSQENLEQAIQSIDTLQLAEVENFLNCDLGSTLQVKLTTENLDDVDNKAGFIYPIILEDRLEVIFKLPGKPLKYHTNLVDRATVEQTLRELKRAILRGYPEPTISSSQIVYNWLIQPLETYLESNEEITTLVFVLDGELRNIPMGVLYDSQKQEYLIQKQYALALLPSFQVFDLQKQSTPLKVLGAGISEKLQVENKSFVGLNVTEELDSIEAIIPSSILLNSQFTQANIQQNLDEGDFSVVHLATHGNFSSNPENTYLVVYDADTTKGSLLKARDLDKLLRQKGEQQPIELLVLSACETAEGDTRATLGLAGLAIQAGTRSTLATLWQVSDASTVKLMTRFYQELSTPGTSKAIALHRAQQSLLDDPNYQAPYYWSPYVLVGNWR